MEHTTTWATDTASFEEDTWMMEALDAAENSRNQAERLVQREKALRVRQQHDGAEANGGADVHAVGPFTVGFTGSPDMLTLANHGLGHASVSEVNGTGTIRYTEENAKSLIFLMQKHIALGKQFEGILADLNKAVTQAKQKRERRQHQVRRASGLNKEE